MNRTYSGLMLVMIGVALIGSIYIYRARQYGLEKQIALARASVKPAQSSDKRQIYNNDRIGARLMLPNEFLARDYSPVSVFILPQDNTTSGESKRFLYLSIMRLNFPDELRDGYNYSEQTMKRILAMKIGDVAAINDTAGQDEWHTYQRLQDRKLSGIPMRVFVNENPKDFPKGTTEYRYVAQVGNRIVIVGGYVGAAGDTELDYKKFDSILSSILFSF